MSKSKLILTQYRTAGLCLWVAAVGICWGSRVRADERIDPTSLAFSDPAKAVQMPAWAVGQANRDPKLDVLPGFQKPPAGFGMVPFFWWLGDPLTQERLGWILGQMEGMGISGYQINYAHGYRDGGKSFGMTIASEPALFSEEWWKLTGWFMAESKKQGAAISLSDYTLGIGQGWKLDELMNAHPEVCGGVNKGRPLHRSHAPGIGEAVCE
jgi:hypothetical protein